MTLDFLFMTCPPSPSRMGEEKTERVELGSGGRAQNLFALLPVAGAQLPGLEGVEQAQRLVGVAADIEAVDRDVLDRALWVDDEGRAQRHARLGIEDAERGRQLPLHVR